MTRAEFINLYGDALVVFNSYYKYSFTFTGKLKDGSEINVTLGGSADEIYRESVKPDVAVTVKSLYPYSGGVHRNGKEIHSFYDF